MTDPLFLADVSHAVPGEVVTVSGPEGRHAAVVKRMRPGEGVLLADGAGAGIRGVVDAVAKESITVRVNELIAREHGPLRMVAVQALAKGERSDIAVEAMTELGVDEIIAWQASRSIVRWQAKAEKGLAKWRSAATSATKQSRRLTIPAVSAATTGDIAHRLSRADLALVLHESATEPLADIDLPPHGECIFVIGPEGGIAPDELEQFEAVGAHRVSVSDAVLRASTAGVVALAQLQAISRRLRTP